MTSNVTRPIATMMAVVATLAIMLAVTVCARAEFPGDQVPVRPVRLQGYWGRTKAEQAVIGELTLTAGGRDKRTFGITGVQAYNPEEEGMSVLRHTSLQPALLLRGSDDLVKKLYGATPQQKVTIFGVYGAGAGTLTLSSVEVAPS
jgi:hypothetical protein